MITFPFYLVLSSYLFKDLIGVESGGVADSLVVCVCFEVLAVDLTEKWHLLRLYAPCRSFQKKKYAPCRFLGCKERYFI